MKCENCKYWDLVGLVDENKPDGEKEGFCRKYAPKIVRGMLFQSPDMGGEVDWRVNEHPDCWEGQGAIWPKTLSFKWCGEFAKKGSPSSKISQKNISYLRLSQRAYRALRQQGINTIQDLTEKRSCDILSMRMIGLTTYREIKRVLYEEGLCLAENVPKKRKNQTRQVNPRP